MCTSARNIGHYYLAFILGCAAASSLNPGFALLGLVFATAVSTLVESANRLSDRREDSVNRPERTYLCRLVGFPTLERIAWFSFAILVSYSVGWFVLNPSPYLAFLLVASVIIAVTYSYAPGGVRPLKRSRWLSSVLLTIPTVGPFLTAYFGTAEKGPSELVGTPLAFLVVAFLVLLVATGAKDVTDLAGDELIGYRSLWVDVVTTRNVSTVMAAAFPPVVLLVLSLYGPLPARLSLFAPVVFATLVLLAFRSRTVLSRQGRGGVSVRSLSSHLQLLLVAVIGLLSFWSPGLLAAVGATVVFWFVADRWLYWSRFEVPSGWSELLVHDDAS